MKKLFSSLILFFCAMAPSMAQTGESFQFIDAQDNTVPDGSTITVSELIEDEFMGNNMNSGLKVKNVGLTAEYVRVVYDITTLDNGSLQVCFPVTCNSQEAKGTYETTPGSMAPGAVYDLQSEWFPTAFGTCVVTYRLEVMKQVGLFPYQSYEKVADGPSVTVVFNYADPAHIAATQRQASPTSACFDLLGRPVTRMGSKALRIVRLQDGTVQKRVGK